MPTSELHAIDITDLITKTTKDYEDLSLPIANKPFKLSFIKNKLEKNRLTSSLFDPKSNFHHIEVILQSFS